jgi:hypothetical protein
MGPARPASHPLNPPSIGAAELYSHRITTEPVESVQIHQTRKFVRSQENRRNGAVRRQEVEQDHRDRADAADAQEVAQALGRRQGHQLIRHRRQQQCRRHR